MWRMGWIWVTPFIVVSDFDQEASITNYVPCLLGAFVHGACIRALERKAMANHQDIIPLEEGMDHHDHQGRKVCMDAISTCIKPT